MAVAFNPLDPAMAVDPYPHYRALREQDPVHRSEMGFWVLTRHADVATVLSDGATFQHCYAQTQQARFGAAVAEERYFPHFQRMLFVLDPPMHTRVRAAIQGFLAKRLAATKPRIAAFSRGLMERHAGARRIELIADYGYRLPQSVIGDMLGVPPQDHEQIADWADTLSPVLEFLPMSPETLATANASVGRLEGYFRALIDLKGREPREDLLSDFAGSIAQEGGLSEAEAISNAMLMYLAGYDTTAGVIGLSLLALHRNPDQWARLVADPGLASRAADELLRFDTAGQGTARVALQDVAIGETTIPAGSMVLAYIGAALRDPAVYADAEALDITAVRRGALTFGGGAHACVGQAIARFELVTTLDLLAREYPTLRLETLEPEFRKTALVRGVAELPASW